MPIPAKNSQVVPIQNANVDVRETLAMEVESDQLVNRIIEAEAQDDKEAVESFLCGKFFNMI